MLAHFTNCCTAGSLLYKKKANLFINHNSYTEQVTVCFVYTVSFKGIKNKRNKETWEIFTEETEQEEGCTLLTLLFVLYKPTRWHYCTTYKCLKKHKPLDSCSETEYDCPVLLHHPTSAQLIQDNINHVTGFMPPSNQSSNLYFFCPTHKYLTL